MILADCLTVNQIIQYNLKNGANNYIDPLTQIFCVQFDNSPQVGDYWIEKSAIDLSDIGNV